ncbi:hypothetical protein HNR44_002098 [Geomicrobium halophilum]|uniref:Uncharacterized protein n=1 Tax=Geomicrobium halophilum TaxID=549000 RepID=A0A841PMY3_9BACL|nr:hypothetical protein [Geomicrobium halophilum]MBB6450120.1 hypothetical protein [Geomicrobium halophilum]
MTNKGKKWYKIRPRDGIFLLGIFFYVIVFFLPWSYDVMILNVSLVAWGAYLLHVLVPAVGILLIISEKDISSRKPEHMEAGISKDK